MPDQAGAELLSSLATIPFGRCTWLGEGHTIGGSPGNYPAFGADKAAVDQHGAQRRAVDRPLRRPAGNQHDETLRRLLAFIGPGYLVAVGYMDPGNWATDLAGGSAFGYTLLSVILLSNLMAILLQSLAARLGIATGQDLAQACRAHYRPSVNFALWLLCEIAIIACDLAEVIGTAIALQLLFGIPLLLGATLTALDVLLILLLQQRGFRYLEAFIISLISVIAICFLIEIALADPVWGDVAFGFIPQPEILTNPAMLYIAIGILGATVMPHNLYLHSSIVQTRRWEQTPKGRREAVLFSTIDSTVALSLALFVNAAILILAANTAYADFPRLSSIIARDSFLPRQFANRGDRLVFSNGVLILAVMASVLLVVFQGDVSKLIPLYAVGVFTSFTLSQTGMVRHHLTLKEPGWRRNMVINGIGSATTFRAHSASARSRGRNEGSRGTPASSGRANRC